VIDPNMSLKDVAQLDGVKDLPMAAKAKFAQALLAEAKGDHANATRLLNEAVERESNPMAGVKGAVA
jgi:hypothetical protein